MLQKKKKKKKIYRGDILKDEFRRFELGLLGVS